MCGIAGVVDFEGRVGIDYRELQSMAGALAHRGPDGLEAYVDRASGQCGLAHSRLAVIDIAGGKQPMTNEDGRYWITYNGECYNFPELRRDLEQAGHQFKSRSDTEVVLHLYEQYGPACVEHLRGMFAFAVWDSRQRSLFLARDRLGQKPLYWALHEGRFLFASECKALLRAQGLPRRVNLAAVLRYLLLGYVPPMESAFADIRALPPAHRLLVTPETWQSARPERYWQLPEENSFAGTFEDGCMALRAALAEAVRLRLVSDVPLGAFLSGGMDSTAVVGLMSNMTDNPVATCTIKFRERRYDESGHAEAVARRFGCEHETYAADMDPTALVEQVNHFYDEPFADSSALPTCQLSQMARPRVTVALTGDGGDECLGGYDRYRALMLSERLARSRLLRWALTRGLWGKLAAGEHHSVIHRLRRLAAATDMAPAQRYLSWVAVFSPDLLAGICRPEILQAAPHAADWEHYDEFFAAEADEPLRGANLAGRAMRADTASYLPGDLNTKIDRASMAVGLELRCPFQDHKLVELAHSFPAAWRHNGSVGKVILRRALTDLLPAHVSRRKKMGFGVPIGQWLRTGLRPMFEDLVLSGQALERGYFERRALERLWAEHLAKREDHGHRLWALLMLEMWRRRYVDRE